MLIRKLYNRSILSDFGIAIILATKTIAIITIIYGAIQITVSPAHANFVASVKTMNAHTFYTRALRLQKLGSRAVLDPDLRKLVSHARRSFRTLETQNTRAKRNGKPLYCKKSDDNMSPKQVIRHLGQIPKVKRQNINITRAFLIIAKKKYPC